MAHKRMQVKSPSPSILSNSAFSEFYRDRLKAVSFISLVQTCSKAYQNLSLCIKMKWQVHDLILYFTTNFPVIVPSHMYMMHLLYVSVFTTVQRGNRLKHFKDQEK